MIQLGEIQDLQIVRQKQFGVYLAEPADSDQPVKTDRQAKSEAQDVLLPAKEVPEGAVIGDVVQVFVYRDSDDRLIATTARPKVTLGKTALLEVKQVTGIGAFLDWGLPKDLFLPFKEQTVRVRQDQKVMAALYIDKSDRLCATMKIYSYLTSESPYRKEDMVQGHIYQIHPTYGAFVAVDDRYHGMIPASELHGRFRVGDSVEARVSRIREDGKLELSTHERIQIQIDKDAAVVDRLLESYGGVLPFTEKASPAVIERETGLSKAAFKRAVGRLLKMEKIRIIDGKIRKTEQKQTGIE